MIFGSVFEGNSHPERPKFLPRSINDHSKVHTCSRLPPGASPDLIFRGFGEVCGRKFIAFLYDFDIQCSFRTRPYSLYSNASFACSFISLFSSFLVWWHPCSVVSLFICFLVQWFPCSVVSVFGCFLVQWFPYSVSGFLVQWFARSVVSFLFGFLVHWFPW